ncbi:MAG: elongation factor Ts [Ruminococcaceae bacterium]|nr:elongation factor Ts [Oscillospiraceae bacterium]
MAAITAKMVNDLRAKTGVGMMDCKKALVETDGNFDEAIKVLREKGLGKADKKAGRIAAEGVVDIATVGDVTAIIEVNAETDFVAKNDAFKTFVKGILNVIVNNKPADMDALKALPYDGEFTVEAKLKDMIYTIGENMNIRRFEIIEGVTSSYIHGNGMAGVVVKFNACPCLKENAEFCEMAKNVALQIAAGTPPTYVKREDVPASVLEEEKNILMAQIKNDEKNANKPDAIIAKMVEGRIGKFYEKSCLVDQQYVKDEALTVGKYVEQVAKSLDKEISIDSFVLFERGEGLEKREDDFAEEIAKLTGKQ